MNATEWNRARSDFNHGWLKNRLIVSLFRASRILSGAVTDESGLDVLKSLLTQWPERKVEADDLIDSYLSYENTAPLSKSEECIQYLHTVALQRWQETEHPVQKASAAGDALKELDEEIQAITGLSPDAVERLHAKAQKLAKALSDLSILILPHC